MTLTAFDPVALGRYRAAKPPKLLHFQFEGSESVHRYILVDLIPINEINAATRRKPNEGSDDDIVRRYLNPCGQGAKPATFDGATPATVETSEDQEQEAGPDPAVIG